MPIGSTLAGLAWDAWGAGRGQPAAITARQQLRLAGLVRYARARAPLYRKLYQHLPPDVNDLGYLPPVTKRRLMASFDDWVTDRAVTRAGVEAFIADETRIGQRYLGRYAVWTSSGVTGARGILVHDDTDLAVYRALTLVRDRLAWATPARLWTTLRQGDRVAIVVATGGHHASSGMAAVARRHRPWPFNRIRTFSALRPVSDLVEALNGFQPAELNGYPSALALLAREQLAGRLAIHPATVSTGGEWLSPAARRAIEAAFGCRTLERYGTSEFPRLALGCRQGRLHLNADWAILEPVDENHQPVPPGQASYTALLTNLANRVQPLIRYDLGDSITAGTAPCSCGSPLPVIQVEGRRGEILMLETPTGETIPLLPIPVADRVEEVPGVQACQVIQTGPARLTVRLELAPGAEARQVWAEVAGRLRDYLLAHGLPQASVERASEPPERDPVSGKLRHVWADLEAAPRRPSGPQAP